MDHLIGHFCYKKTFNGNLIGEFSNNNLLVVKSELAEPEENPETFIGTFNTSWLEFGKSTTMTLKIGYKSDTNKKIFELTWSNKKEVAFWGEGFIVDGMLVGSYRDIE